MYLQTTYVDVTVTCVANYGFNARPRVSTVNLLKFCFIRESYAFSRLRTRYDIVNVLVGHYTGYVMQACQGGTYTLGTADVAYKPH